MPTRANPGGAGEAYRWRAIVASGGVLHQKALLLNPDLSTGVTVAGAINIVTRSGGNGFHGSGFYFFRDHNMSAYPGLSRDRSNPDPFFARRQAGFYVGGPIKANRIFFFTPCAERELNAKAQMKTIAVKRRVFRGKLSMLSIRNLLVR